MSCRLASCRISRIVPPRVVRPIRILRNGRLARSASSTARRPPIASPSTAASLGSGPGGICGGPATVGGDPPLWPGGAVVHENAGFSHSCSDTVGCGKVPLRPGLLGSGQDKGHDFVERLHGLLGEQLRGLLPARGGQITDSSGQLLIGPTFPAA